MQFIARCKIVLAVFLILSGNAFAACDANTMFLLHANGTDGSTTITDSSVSARTFTAAGNAQLDTAQQKFGTASLLGDGTGDYVYTDDSTDFTIGTGNFTIDFWFRTADNTKRMSIFEQYQDATNFHYVEYNPGGGGSLHIYVYRDPNDTEIGAAWLPSNDTWYHIALVRNGTTTYTFYVDGTAITNTYTDTDVTNWSNLTGNVNVGRQTDGGFSFQGWMDEIRYSNTARWTSNFTPSISEYCGATSTALFIGDLI